jgi:hypothetical protein
MPIIDICDEGGKIHSWASARLYATMLYPEDDGMREQIFEQMLVCGFDLSVSNIARLRDSDRAHLTNIRLSAYQNLDRAGFGSRAVIEDAGRVGGQGWVAGLLLQYLLRCGVHCLEHASMNKAYWVVNNLQDPANREPGTIGMAESKLKEYWKYHNADAHLHAATIAFERNGSGDIWLAIENIPIFLAISEFYAARASQQCYRGTNTPLMDLSSIWRPPPHLKLPEVNFAEAKDDLLPPLGAEELTVLNKYRAR